MNSREQQEPPRKVSLRIDNDDKLPRNEGVETDRESQSPRQVWSRHTVRLQKTPEIQPALQPH